MQKHSDRVHHSLAPQFQFTGIQEAAESDTQSLHQKHLHEALPQEGSTYHQETPPCYCGEEDMESLSSTHLIQEQLLSYSYSALESTIILVWVWHYFLNDQGLVLHNVLFYCAVDFFSLSCRIYVYFVFMDSPQSMCL